VSLTDISSEMYNEHMDNLVTLKTVLMSCRTEVGKLAGERAGLLKKLVEVEMDGKAAGEQMIKLRDTVRRLKEVNIVCTFYI